MGLVFVRLAARGSVHPRWTRHAATALDGFNNCLVAIYDPNTERDNDSFNIYLNKSTAAPTELWRGMGQLQVFRQTLNAEMPAGSITQVRSVRITVPLDGPTVPIRKGLIVRVLECEHDDDATKYQYTVTSGLNSGLAFKRTIEAEADMGVVLSSSTSPLPVTNTVAEPVPDTV